jgi:hypothetical protein
MAVHRGNRWTLAEDNHLRQLIAEGTSITLISAKLKRSPQALRMRVFKLRMPCEAKPIPTPQAGNIVKSSGTLRVTKPDIWYVAYGPNKAIQTDGKGHYARATKTFHSEIEAQIFAAQLLAEGWSVSAGTLNPHEPKKIISRSQIGDWADPGRHC